MRMSTIACVAASLAAASCHGTIDLGNGPDAGGVAGAGGSGGSGGAESTSTWDGPMVRADKVDLLLMIDNSPGMAEKQKLLAAALPDLLHRLTNPVCVDPTTKSFVATAAPGAACPADSVREFPAVKDMHVGVITSSLGGHGADSCTAEQGVGYNSTQHDMARLITRTDDSSGVTSYQLKGYLNWDPAAGSTPPGEADINKLSADFTDVVTGAGDVGCGYESQLEAWYRFLVEPAPYERMAPCPCAGEDGLNCRCPDWIDEDVLQQRKDFLRPDSLVVVLMVTDEDDCSVRDSDRNFLVLQAMDGSYPFHVAPGTAICATDPSSPACKSCWEAAATPADPNLYPECFPAQDDRIGWDDPEKQDPLNLRCYRQKQRFGTDSLTPVTRYVKALTSGVLEDGSPNPLFVERDRSRVVLAGIVGVPWQDIARDRLDPAKGFKTALEIPWGVIAGDPDNDVDPTDPFMIPSIDPRSGTSPFTGETLAPSTSGPLANTINGSERDIASRADLQYACTFELPQPIDCTDPAQDGKCDCVPGNTNPLCYDPQTQSFGTTQYRGGAYPGTRELAVLHGIGHQAVVGSICSANQQTQDSAAYGYRPAIQALVDRMILNLNSTVQP